MPATIAGLIYWYKSDSLVNGSSLPCIPNSALNGAFEALSNAAAPATVSGTLNSLPVIALVGGEDYTVNVGGLGALPILHKSTLFAVVKPTNLSGGSGFGADILCGPSNSSLEVRVTNTGLGELVKRFVAVIGNSTTAVATVGSWSQFNYTYDDSSGAFAWRSARAANGSGTNALAISQPSTDLLWFGGGATQDWIGSVAEIIVFNRVLTGTEITNVENYLNTKWGV